MIVAWIKPATVQVVLPQYALPFMMFAFTWLLFSSVGDKYRVVEEDNFISIAIKTTIINIFIIAFIFAILLLFKISFSRLIVFGTIAFATVGELILFFIFYYTQRFFIDNPSFAKTPMVMEFKVPQYISESEVKDISLSVDSKKRYDPNFGIALSVDDSILTPLLNNYLNQREKVFSFINAHVALDNIDRANSTIISTGTQYNVDHLSDNSQEMILNLHPMNDYRRINKFLISINRSMKNNAIFIGNGETLTQRHKRFLSKKYPRLINHIFRGLDFIINRAFPKMSATKGIYFALTKGRNRPLSKCEILGRLYFCGFEVIATEEIHNKLFFIMRKVKEPSKDENPSYAPIFKMKRSGKGGKPIYIYKFRTMHPYAEYLQHYMVENVGYGEKGKVENDFRVTSWGKWMRKLWLDESPQIFNWLRRDLAIVGVRPLSDRFLAEYPEELKEERFKYKPGCIPPYVALRMQAVEEYIESERIYLAEKKKHPIWTDIKYFWWAVFNILANRIRSE